MNWTPKGIERASGPRTSRKKMTRSGSSSSVARTSSFLPLTVMVARPAARRLRTHWTSPQGAHTQRRPEAWTIATGVVLGAPLLRPRTVRRPFGPSGRPARRSALVSGFHKATHRGAAAGRFWSLVDRARSLTGGPARDPVWAY